MSHTVLVVADDVPERTLIAQALQRKLSYRIIPISTRTAGQACQPRGCAEKVDLALVDTVAGSRDACRVVAQIRQARPDLPVVVLVSAGLGDISAQLIAAGADDVLIRPVTLDRLRISLSVQIQIHTLRRRLQLATVYPLSDDSFSAILFRNPAMQLAMAWARATGQREEHVWIDGEAGVGKTMLVRAIHAASARSGTTLLMMTGEALCSALQTGGYGFKQAAGGMLVLENPLHLPKKQLSDLVVGLLPVLRERNIRLAVTQTSPCDGQEEIADWTSSLGMRCRITLPPLRERGEDRVLLARNFVRKYTTAEGIPTMNLLPDAEAWIEGTRWEGNVRELARCMYRAVMLSGGEALSADILELVLSTARWREHGVSASACAINLLGDNGRIKPMTEIENEVIALVLKRENGCMARASRMLGIGRSTLYRKLEVIG